MTYIYKLMFMLTLVMGTMITISSKTWLGTWMGLELNLLSFIPIISMKNNPYSSESSIKYFIIQAIASSILLMTIIILMMKSKLISESFMMNKSIYMIMNSTMCLKLGSAPFHFWFPEIIEGMNWMNSMILMTWQKIAPMIIMMYTLKSNSFLYLTILMSTFIGSIGGLNQTSLRKILAFSSINHMGWMFSSMSISEMIWLMYFSIYSLISISIILMFNQMKMFLLKQMFLMYKSNKMTNFLMSMNLLSLGGLPPFLGFLPKWMVIQNLSFNMFILTMFMIMMTLITLFFYIRIIYSNILLKNNELMFFPINNNFKLNNKTNFFSFISIFGLILYTLIMNFM
uniref:NADH-ubiquinone oxidoreductase chain 2 n=1 Tax=Limbodessus palmulaoides TaxID=985783 RepID=A0A343W9W4_9DYTI|nr:NADH dehydrogenase subunit 2 [Limbodessus palmulaoides]AVZ66429.1 NADH dehydrogenase subunit 2 [Limbodessus palmulaoides]